MLYDDYTLLKNLQCVFAFIKFLNTAMSSPKLFMAISKD